MTDDDIDGDAPATPQLGPARAVAPGRRVGHRRPFLQQGPVTLFLVYASTLRTSLWTGCFNHPESENYTEIYAIRIIRLEWPRPFPPPKVIDPFRCTPPQDVWLWTAVLIYFHSMQKNK